MNDVSLGHSDPLKSGGSNLQGFKNGAVETIRDNARNVGLPVY
jgi:hypothetical protein